MFTLNCKGKIIGLERPLIMGIINATPDSFYRGDLAQGIDGVVQAAAVMIENRADMIDIGGQSTRPGSKRISCEEELERVIPVIKAIHERFPEAILSADTYHAAVAAAAVAAGASIVNDISGGTMDRRMIPQVAALGVPYICMHMKGTPETMQADPEYADVVKEVLEFFVAKTDECTKAGIRDVIIDPGFGFGKTIAHNLTLLRELAVFKMLDKPVLAGLSRKGTVYKTLQVSVGEALNGTTVLNTIALLNGADILRVHDVREAREAVTLVEAYKKIAPLPESDLY
jgi:dihydropteroate synthase